MKEQLEKFGRVVQYEQGRTEIHVIVEGFENTIDNALSLMKIITQAHPRFEKTHRFTVKEGLFHLILKK